MELICTACAARYAATEPIWRCACGGLFDLDWQPALDPAGLVGRPWSMWRYREVLPIHKDEHVVTLGEGCTPLVPAGLGGREVLVKQDYLCPTGSYKDRGASVLMSQVKSLGIDHVVEDSSGNAGCAVAAYGARGGIDTDIYVPASTSPDKLAQIEAYGANLLRVPGSREDTSTAVMAVAETTYYASHSWNPFFFHGTKTVAYEICEQMGWRVPDVLILPVGNGTLYLGAWIGFGELAAMGLIERIPRLIGVQAEACAPLAKAWRAGEDVPSSVPSGGTLAEGIAIAAPVRGAQILQAARETDGELLTVSDVETVSALRDLHRRGFYVEPTSATVWAAAKQLVDNLPSSASLAVVLTGHGLKASSKITHLNQEED